MPDEDPLDVGGGDANAAFFDIPGDLVHRIAEHGAVEFRFEVQLREAVRPGDIEQRELSDTRAIAGAFIQQVSCTDLNHVPFEEVARDLVDERLGVIEDETALAPPGAADPLLALVEREVLAVVAQAILVDRAELEW